MKARIEQAVRGEVAVSFAPYDWLLNSQAPSVAPKSATQQANFGSGSIPNESPVEESTEFGSGSIPNASPRAAPAEFGSGSIPNG